jgi:hypothetical protein
MANLSEADISNIFARVTGHAMTLGRFEQVNTHEPKNAPASKGLTAAVWVDYIGPAIGSGLQSTSALLVLMVRIYTKFLQEPVDMIDPSVLAAVSDLIGAYSGDFDFGMTIRCVDLLGMTGKKLEAQAGYIDIDRKIFRVMTVTLPIIINDAWAQAG